MWKYIIGCTVAGFLTAGCASPGRFSTESIPVKQMRVNGVDLAYVEEGGGPTVLFVHGAFGDWRTWEVMRPYVSSRYRFVSMSRRYHYPNAWADDGRHYNFDQHVEDLAGFIRAMNVGKVHLVGNSYSGRLAGVLAVKYPELLRSVVLGEPSLVAPGSAEGKAALAAVGKELGAAAAAAKAGNHRQGAIMVANAVLDDPEGFNKLPKIRQQRWLENERTAHPMFSGASATSVSCEQLKNLKVPAIAIRGELTRANFKHGHDALVSCLPTLAENAIVPRGNHIWAVENPDAAASAILSFIAKH